MPHTRRQNEETNEQCHVIYWLNRAYPNVKTIISPIVKFGTAQQRMIHGKIMKGMGYVAGTPDLFLPIAKHGYHGLFIEMKKVDGTTQPEQREFLCWLEAQGYSATVCFGADAAIKYIDWYLKG